LALTGDSVDNIPGVPGVGKKTAALLFAAFGSLDDLYANLHRIPLMKLRGGAAVAARLLEHSFFDTHGFGNILRQQVRRIAAGVNPNN
jgi:5'-3' exonuclease